MNSQTSVKAEKKNKIHSDSPLTKAQQKEHTRNRVLQAVLDIVVSDGMRAVRHRAVAEKAGVALGTTTYHFSSIEDLIISAFGYWRTRVRRIDNPFYVQLTNLLSPYQHSLVPENERSQIAAQIYEISVNYLIDQITEKREDRIIELAFYHESMLYQSLRDEMKATWGLELGDLESTHAIMGSEKPAEDARITFTLFRQLEQSSILTGTLEIDEDVIRNTLHRNMSLCFAVDLPALVA